MLDSGRGSQDMIDLKSMTGACSATTYQRLFPSNGVQNNYGNDNKCNYATVNCQNCSGPSATLALELG